LIRNRNASSFHDFVLQRKVGLPGFLSIWIKGNAGLQEIVQGKAVYKTTPEQFATFAQPLLDAGADFIGGYCGTSPEFILALKNFLTL
jgi:methionine synthase I (cobalamin-dependent)